MQTLEMIVPCYNEQETIKVFYDTVCPILDNINNVDYSLIFVDDGSKDNTLKIIKELSQKDSHVKYISFSRNFGKEGAMLAGLKYSKADYVGIIDADLQHSPHLIPEMLKAIVDEDYDVAAAKRSDRNGETKLKSVLSSMFYKLSNAITEVDIDEGAQDFRIMKRKVVDTIVSLSEKERFTKGIFSFVGFNTKWFSHENSKRVAGESKWSIFKLLKYAMNGILGYTNAPLKIPGFVGILMIILGIVLLIINGTGSVNVGIIISIVSIFSGIILLCIGVVTEYIARIYTEVKNRPVYIVSETNIDL